MRRGQSNDTKCATLDSSSSKSYLLLSFSSSSITLSSASVQKVARLFLTSLSFSLKMPSLIRMASSSAPSPCASPCASPSSFVFFLFSFCEQSPPPVAAVADELIFHSALNDRQNLTVNQALVSNDHHQHLLTQSTLAEWYSLFLFFSFTATQSGGQIIYITR